MGALLASAFSLVIAAGYKIYSYLVLEISQLDSHLSSDWFQFVSYTLNFNFIGILISIYYFIFVSFIAVVIVLRIFSVTASLLPSIVSIIRSYINMATGDN